MRSAHRRRDDRLLEELRSALALPVVEPSAAERAAFRELAARACRSRLPAEPGGSFAVRWRVLPALAVGALLLLVTTVATIERVPATDPVRTVAHSLGLPIESTELVQTRRAMSDVRGALGEADAQSVAEAAARLRARLDRLERQEGAAVVADARALLDEAAAALRRAEEAAPEQGERPTEEPEVPPPTDPDKRGPAAPDGPRAGRSATVPPSDPGTGDGDPGDAPAATEITPPTGFVW